MNVERITALAAPPRRDARHRARIAVALYAVCLVALVAIGSYLAPSGLVADDDGADATVEAR